MKNENEKYLPSNIFEGLTSIRAIIKAREEGHSDRKINEIIYDAERKKKYGKEIAWLGRMAKKHDFTLTESNSDKVSELTIGTTHGGFVALCDERTLPRLEEIEIKKDGFYVMLDGIEDPYNFGTAVRTMYAAGVTGIVLPERNWMASAGIVCRSSAGASEMADIIVSDTEKAVAAFRDNGYKIVCSAMENSVPMYDADLTFPVFLIIGGEMRGISKKVLSTADVTIRIEYGRDYKAALSAQSSAAVLAFEVFRQNKK